MKLINTPDAVSAARHYADHDSSRHFDNLAKRMDIKKIIARRYSYAFEHEARKAYTAYVDAFIEARRLQREWGRKGQPVPEDERRRVDEQLARAMNLAGVPTVK